MKYLFFDTETNGKPKKYGAKMTDLDNWPRVTQLAWCLFDDDGLVSQSAKIILPDGWTVPEEQFFIDNNMSTARCEAEGTAMPEVLRFFISEAKEADYLIAHNIDFDYNVLGAEMLRYKMSVGKKLQQVCTMKAGTDWCEIPGPYGFKWPKLSELFQTLFDEEMGEAHDALVDVINTAKCFFAMKERGIIKLEVPA